MYSYAHNIPGLYAHDCWVANLDSTCARCYEEKREDNEDYLYVQAKPQGKRAFFSTLLVQIKSLISCLKPPREFASTLTPHNAAERKVSLDIHQDNGDVQSVSGVHDESPLRPEVEAALKEGEICTRDDDFEEFSLPNAVVEASNVSRYPEFVIEGVCLSEEYDHESGSDVHDESPLSLEIEEALEEGEPRTRDDDLEQVSHPNEVVEASNVSKYREVVIEGVCLSEEYDLENGPSPLGRALANADFSFSTSFIQEFSSVHVDAEAWVEGQVGEKLQPKAKIAPRGLKMLLRKSSPRSSETQSGLFKTLPRFFKQEHQEKRHSEVSQDTEGAICESYDFTAGPSPLGLARNADRIKIENAFSLITIETSTGSS